MLTKFSASCIRYTAQMDVTYHILCRKLWSHGFFQICVVTWSPWQFACVVT